MQLKFINTIGQRFYFLGFGMVGLLLIFGSFCYYNASQLMNQLADVSHNKMPAIKNQTLADMMHDGMRGVVMEGLYKYNQGNKKALTELQKEGIDKGKDFFGYINELKKLKLTKEILEKIESVDPVLKKYAETTEKILTLIASKGEINKDELENLEKEFSSSFVEVEEKMELMGDGIAKEAESMANDGEKNLQLILMSLFLIGFIGISISILLSSNTKKIFNKVSTALNKAVSSSKEACTNAQLSAQNIAAASVEQNQAVSNCTKISSQTKKLVEHNTKLIQNSLDKTKAVVLSTKEGEENIDSLINSIDNMHEMMNEFQDLAQAIKEIDSKTAVINDIVIKTQLLSFNASIEAARAGDYGRGFSVVAEEISKLAITSGNAANSIQKLLVESNVKVEKMGNHITNKIAVSKEISGTVSVTINKIFNQILDVEKDFIEIQQACNEEVNSIIESNSAIEQIDSSSRNNSRSAQSSLQSVLKIIDLNKLIEDAACEIGKIASSSYEDKNSDEQNSSRRAA